METFPSSGRGESYRLKEHNNLINSFNEPRMLKFGILVKVGTLLNGKIEKSKFPFFRVRNEGVKFIG